MRGILGYLRKAFEYSPRHLVHLGLVVTAYAALEATEMVGLWFNKRWAEYLTLVATTLLVPLEIYELVLGVSAFKVVTLVINLAIVVYLLLAKRLFGLRGGHRAEVERRRRDSADGPPSIGLTPPCRLHALSIRPRRFPSVHVVLGSARGRPSGIVPRYGPLAQLVAHLHDTQGVVGSSPARPTV